MIFSTPNSKFEKSEKSEKTKNLKIYWLKILLRKKILIENATTKKNHKNQKKVNVQELSKHVQ